MNLYELNPINLMLIKFYLGANNPIAPFQMSVNIDTYIFSITIYVIPEYYVTLPLIVGTDIKKLAL